MFDIIKQRLSLITLLEKDLKVSFRKIGDVNWAIDGDKTLESCPFCGHHDCFRVKEVEDSYSESFYKCFSCGKSGDIFEWRKSRNASMTLSEVARELAQEFDIDLPRNFNPIQQIFNLAANYYHNCLLDTCDRPYPTLGGKTPRGYQLNIRKRKESSIEKFKIGFSDGGLTAFLDSLGIDKELMESSGLVKNGRDFFRAGFFIYPHYCKGKVSHFTFKDPTKRVAYQLPKKFSLNGYLFYGQDTVSSDSTIVLVEGENDYLAVREAGAPAALAIIGQISGEQLEWIRQNLQGKKIVTIFDPDEAGDNYRKKVEGLRKNFAALVHVFPPDSKDIDEHLTEGANFTELISKNLVKVTPPETKPSLDLPWENMVPPAGVATKPATSACVDPLGSPLDGPTEARNLEVVAPAIPAAKYVPPAVLGALNGSVSSGQEEESAEDEEFQVVPLENNSVIQKNNCYYRITYKDGDEIATRISNFTLHLDYVYINEDGTRNREVTILRYDGLKKEGIVLDSESKVSARIFKVKMADAADCEWLGTQSDLDAMWRLVYDRNPEHTIEIRQTVGRSDKDRCWLFKNVLIADTGVVYEPDENGVFWFNSKKGIKVKSVSSNKDLFEVIPELNTKLPKEEVSTLLRDVIYGLALNFKGPNTDRQLGPALTAIGWLKANCYSDSIFKHHGGMGLLMLWGVNGKGKSTLCRWMQRFFGLAPKMASTSVQQLRGGVGFTRLGAYYSSIPILLDELRANNESNEYLGMIRSWYDREGRFKAGKTEEDVMSVKVRSTLMIAGEDLPGDPATKERCIMLRVPPPSSTKDNDDAMRIHYQWMEERADLFSAIGYSWILESTQVDHKSIIDGISLLDKTLVSAGCSNRISKVWASAGYFAIEIAKELFPDFDYLGYLIKTCTEEQAQQRNDSTLFNFFEIASIIAARENAKINENHFVKKGDQIHIWFPAFFKEVSDDCRGRLEFSKNMLIKAIKEEPFYVCDDKKITLGLEGIRRNVITLNLPQAPEPLRNMVQYSDQEPKLNDESKP